MSPIYTGLLRECFAIQNYNQKKIPAFYRFQIIGYSFKVLTLGKMFDLILASVTKSDANENQLRKEIFQERVHRLLEFYLMYTVQKEDYYHKMSNA